MPDENRIFDVTKPSRVNPSATSRPIIVGRQPAMADPMVKNQAYTTHEPAKITVNEKPSADSGLFTSEAAQPPADVPADFKEPAIIHEPSTLTSGPEPAAEAQSEPAPKPLDGLSQPASVSPDGPAPHIEELHFSAPDRRRKWPWLLLVILALLIGAYLAIDSGLINSNINLPVHFFKQTTNSPPPAASNSSTNSSNNSPSIPAGFSKYRLTGTDLTFAAPTTWGSPTSTAVPGYSKRGSNNPSDGTYAYVVDFATNKDVELAVTSDKYLPAAGPTLYYNYLQWCTGTNDGQLYESILHFTTANKIDTPTTITCDQGPVPNASKINSTTIVQSKAQDTTGKTIGDIYTMNLKDPNLAVLRIKDAAMTNAAAIKQLLGTIQVSSSSTTQ